MKVDDIPSFHAYRSNEEVARYQSWSNFTMEDASAFVEGQVNRNPNVPGQWIQLAIRNSETADLLGDCAFCSDEDQPEIVHIGVTIAPDQQCKGLAQRSMHILFMYIFICMDVWMYGCMYYVSIIMYYLSISMYVCVYVCMYLYERGL